MGSVDEIVYRGMGSVNVVVYWGIGSLNVIVYWGTGSADSSNSRDDDVIMVLSDEDEQQAEDEDHVEDEGEEDDYEDDEDEDEDEEEDEDIEEAEEPDDVEIIDADEGSQQQASQGGPSSDVTSSRPSVTLHPLAPAQGGERLTQDSARTQQIAPFMLGSMVEEDDCTVPRTPTLTQLRRADGFAEALNSPAVNQRFLFGGDSGNHPELAQLESQRALGMDDTRVDLSQFDETGGRSLPTTPTVAEGRQDVAQPEGFSENQGSLESSLQFSDISSGRQDVAQPEGFSVENQGSLESSLQFSDISSFESARMSREGEQGGEEGDELLEGDGGEEEIVEGNAEEEATSTDPQASGEGPSRPNVGKDESDAMSRDKPEGTAKPQIKKIVWDAPSDSSSAASSSSTPLGIGTVLGGAVIPSLAGQTQQQMRSAQGRAQGLRRGGPTRGRSGPQYWGPGAASGQGQSRGGPFSYRGTRGGRGFRGV
ncbi:nucleoprotein tpr [Plakobranchus ocellatus]|uniref:Nucleoprotein tpr n=1 Tax=Plakobranchus ocellatus TaxID=259542 RepID=A0AAV3YFU4_9GAST|nr:nucleoprotein tpr [Plakobranchus ocellatus]